MFGPSVRRIDLLCHIYSSMVDIALDYLSLLAKKKKDLSLQIRTSAIFDHFC